MKWNTCNRYNLRESPLLLENRSSKKLIINWRTSLVRMFVVFRPITHCKTRLFGHKQMEQLLLSA